MVYIAYIICLGFRWGGGGEGREGTFMVYIAYTKCPCFRGRGSFMVHIAYIINLGFRGGWVFDGLYDL